jgi:Ca2+-binding RTX toxin-like protein
MYAGTGDDTLFGDARTMSGSARGGNDRLSGDDGFDTLYGDAETLSNLSRGGNDRLDGGLGDECALRRREDHVRRRPGRQRPSHRRRRER